MVLAERFAKQFRLVVQFPDCVKILNIVSFILNVYSCNFMTILGFIPFSIRSNGFLLYCFIFYSVPVLNWNKTIFSNCLF